MIKFALVQFVTAVLVMLSSSIPVMVGIAVADLLFFAVWATCVVRRTRRDTFRSRWLQ